MNYLQGVTVLDLSMLLPGPLCSMHLANMGARVIKIENPKIGDGSRYMGGKLPDGNTGIFQQLNSGKESITLNIKRPGGQKLFRQLVAQADVVLEGYRPGTMSQLGIGYEDLIKENEKIIYCAISGYGSIGTNSSHAGHDANFISLSGILFHNRRADGLPALPGIQIGDILGGSYTALSAILAALFAREKTGKGDFLDISMADSSLSLLALAVGELAASNKEEKPGQGMLTGGLVNYDCYEVAESRYIMVGALEDRFFQNFLKQLDEKSFSQLWKNKSLSNEDFKEKLTVYLKTKSYADLEPIFNNPDCCVTPVLNIQEAINHPHFNAKGLIKKFQGEKFLGSPFPGSDFDNEMTAAPQHGENSDQVYQELLKLTPSQLQEYRQGRII